MPDSNINSAVTLSRSVKRRIIVLLCAVLMFSVMNSTMFMIAVPDIADAFSLSPSEVSWVVTGYIIIYAVGALVYGKLADLYPFKRLLTVGLILFAVGSIIGFFSTHFIMVVAARMVQAAGAATVPALVFIAPSRFFKEEQGKVLGIVSSTMAFASGIGPIAGGLIAGAFAWNYLFLVSIFVVITIPFFHKWLPEEEPKSGKVDLPGAFFMAVGVGFFILFITTFGWLYLGISIIFLSVFIWWIFHVETPFVKPGLFLNHAYRTTLITSFFGILTMFSMMFMMPLLLDDVNNLSTTAIGLVLFPGAIAAAFMGRIAGLWTDRFGSWPMVFLALGLTMVGFTSLSIAAGASPLLVSLALVASYVAFPFLQTATANLISSVLPAEETGVGMGVYNLFNFMAGAFGGAVVGALLNQYTGAEAYNPLHFSPGHAGIYSNIFMGMAVMAVINAAVFYFSSGSFRKAGTSSPEQTEQPGKS
ncbi:DHA2 family metal-tetracycline-proton antiporter-like MFS transporter [Sinobaca qinghaiensis]|uniref:DHA2 family metal-tetracycline-proton antiporter-like MFS transporter n=1 Tax=Sinobaca qinghaiensis TaxID=342944 RepID=A0A419UZQ3_9BACL|nr:MFS transporter [Sinobaca qinghaiensis]RKD71162.1 DHA2 family metal-tetracycline-proton antiporter-like MFS transporter [Sinobaca qinghaiensis]